MYSFDGPEAETVRKVKFKGDRKEKLLKFLCEEHEQAMAHREGQMKKWRIWSDQANSRLDIDGAGPKDSNVDMTLTREKMNQAGARLQAPIFQQDHLMAARPRTATPASDDLVRNVEQLLDYITDRVPYGMRQVSDEWVEQFQTFPVGVVKTPFVNRYVNIKKWRSVNIEEYEALLADEEGRKIAVRREPKDGSGEVRYFIEDDAERLDFAGALPEVVPIEDFIVPAYKKEIGDSWESHRFWPTKEHFRFNIRKGIYDEKDDEGNKTIDRIGSPTMRRETLMDPHDRDKQEEQSAKQYEVFETYLAFDVDGDGKEEEIIVTWMREGKLMLSAVHNYYHEYHRPFVVHQYRHVIGSIFGVPQTFILEPLHRAKSASFNQRLDAASKANAVGILVPTGSELIDIYDREGAVEGVFEWTGSKDEIVELKLSQPFTQLPELEDKLDQMANRVSNLSEISFGENEANRPVASSDFARLEEMSYPTSLQVERYRDSFALVVRHMLARYKQFFPEGLDLYFQQETQEGVQVLSQFFQWPEGSIEDQVVIETKVTSSTMSKNLRKQEKMAWVDKLVELYQAMFQLAQMAVQPSPVSMIAVKLLNGLQVAVNSVMAEFELSKKEQMNPQLVSEVQVAQQLSQAMAQLQQQAQGYAQQAQGLAQENAALKQEAAATQGQGMAGNASYQTGVPGPPSMA